MDDAFRGGCSPLQDKCRRDCGHRAAIREYREERQRQVDAEVEETLGYETERRLRREAGLRPITFKDWLVGQRLLRSAGEPSSLPGEESDEFDFEDAYPAVDW